jgi:hypothetical protein
VAHYTDVTLTGDPQLGTVQPESPLFAAVSGDAPPAWALHLGGIMKKTGLLLFLAATLAAAQQNNSAAELPAPDKTLPTAVSFPVERIETPTAADLYCAGFINHQLLPNANYVTGGLQTPSTTQFGNGDMIFLTGSGYQVGQEYTMVRELNDPNRYELYTGQHAQLHELGQPYAELARARVIDTRNKMAVAEIEFGCAPVVPGDIAIPFVEKQPILFHPPLRFDRFAPANHKTSGRIVMAKDFDSELGTGGKIYMNVGANQGVKVGDYFRAVRGYEDDLHNAVDSLSFKANIAEDTQKFQPAIEPNAFTKTNGPVIRVADFPRRAVGEVVIIGTTPTSSTGMIVFAMEDIHVGDGVELDDSQQ